MTTTLVDWLPSRYDRSAASLVHAADRSRSKQVGIMGFSEVAGRERRQALRASVENRGYQFLQDVGGPAGMAECAIAVRKKEWLVEAWDSKEIGPDLGPGDIVLAIAAVVKHRISGIRMLVSFAHLPATVEAQWGSERAGEYRKAVKRWRKWLKALRAKFKIAKQRTLVFADWNLNIKRDWVNKYVTDTFRQMRLPTIKPGDWTHAGGRFIDFCIYRGLAGVWLTALQKHEHSDHRGVRAEVAL